ncbi:MAG: SMP-30/gluconolactonase/LRE family protein [Sphingomonas sp.]|nr:MAG: SMP-30/gluconolactonase/LRE family protein [Sphingomonas sp.]
MPQGQVELVLDARAIIGESPTWVPAEGALYWIDVKAPALHRYEPATGATQEWKLTSDVGAFALLEDGDVLVALRLGLHRLDLASGNLTLLAPPPFDPALFRFNEGACDASGRFWVGVMFDPLDGDPPVQPGRLHSFTLAGGLRPEPDAAELHNGMAWSADGRVFYLSHSNTGVIYAFDYDVADGRLSNKRVFATIPNELGIPDGAAIDVDGGYWCALHGGGKLRRFNADGSVDRDIGLPVSQPTMCAFAGSDLGTMFLTTASDKMSEADRNRERYTGGLFRLLTGKTGIERPLYVW